MPGVGEALHFLEHKGEDVKLPLSFGALSLSGLPHIVPGTSVEGRRQQGVTLPGKEQVLSLLGGPGRDSGMETRPDSWGFA